MSIRIDHEATCPEISPPLCATTELPKHEHHQSVDWLRVGPSFGVGLGKGMQLSASVPIDLRALGIEYTLPNGKAYDPPYGDIHHRNETLFGPVDGTLMFQGFRVFGDSPWTLGAGLGTTLPWGKTHPDPFVLGSKGKTHQHFQLGTGTFVPLADLQVVLAGRLGGNAWVVSRVPLYANGHGYFPGYQTGWGIGPRYMVAARYTAALTVEGTHQWRDAWNNNPSPSSGRDALMAGFANNVRVSGRVGIYGKGVVTMWQASRSSNEKDQLLQRFVATLGVTFQG